jgi:hypothetical protein
MLTDVLVVILRVIWPIIMGLGPRRSWALIWPGGMMLIGLVQAYPEVRRELPWCRQGRHERRTAHLGHPSPSPA